LRTFAPFNGLWLLRRLATMGLPWPSRCAGTHTPGAALLGCCSPLQRGVGPLRKRDRCLPSCFDHV